MCERTPGTVRRQAPGPARFLLRLQGCLLLLEPVQTLLQAFDLSRNSRIAVVRFPLPHLEHRFRLPQLGRQYDPLRRKLTHSIHAVPLLGLVTAAVVDLQVVQIEADLLPAAFTPRKRNPAVFAESRAFADRQAQIAQDAPCVLAGNFDAGRAGIAIQRCHRRFALGSRQLDRPLHFVLEHLVQCRQPIDNRHGSPVDERLVAARHQPHFKRRLSIVKFFYRNQHRRLDRLPSAMECRTRRPACRRCESRPASARWSCRLDCDWRRAG